MTLERPDESALRAARFIADAAFLEVPPTVRLASIQECFHRREIYVGGNIESDHSVLLDSLARDPKGANASSTAWRSAASGPSRRGITLIVHRPDHRTLSVAQSTPSLPARARTTSSAAKFRTNHGVLSILNSSLPSDSAQSPSEPTGGQPSESTVSEKRTFTKCGSLASTSRPYLPVLARRGNDRTCPRSPARGQCCRSSATGCGGACRGGRRGATARSECALDDEACVFSDSAGRCVLSRVQQL